MVFDGGLDPDYLESSCLGWTRSVGFLPSLNLSGSGQTLGFARSDRDGAESGPEEVCACEKSTIGDLRSSLKGGDTWRTSGRSDPGG
jgi:hypothetical protein